MVKKQIDRLMTQVRDLESHIPDKDKSNTAISSGSVGWHIEHSLLAMEQIINSLKRSNPGVYRRKFHVVRELVFMLNKIPRGKGRAPKTTHPKPSTTPEELHEMVRNTLVKISELMDIPESHFFTHPYFGDIKYGRTIKFLNMHTHHHLKIIHDILKSPSLTARTL